MKTSSLNHAYRLVWSHVLNAWVAVSEATKGHGKSRSGKRLLKRSGAALAASALFLSPTLALADQTGGTVVSGVGSISQSANVTNINQSSQTLGLTWDTFNINANQTVNFVQPNAAALAVNRIFDTNGSKIMGNLNANGQVWLINPNGVFFGAGSQVNVGSILASTLNPLSNTGDADQIFGNGGSGSVINQGNITAANGGYVAMLGNKVINEGVITAQMGTVALGAGSKVSLQFNGNQLLGLTIDESTLNNLAENKQLIKADGGAVFMSAGAKDSILASMVNNTGVIEAQTVQNQDGKIILLGGMTAGTTNVGGTLDASAASADNTGTADGGFIETSAANVRIEAGTKVTTQAENGETGTWLIDPTDFTISAGAGASTVSSVGADTLASNLATSDITIQTTSGGADAGNINVDAAVSWASANALTLESKFGAGAGGGGININQDITFINGGLNLDATGTITAAGDINGKTFDLKNGTWSQVGPALAAFNVTDFRISGGKFIRALGGNGAAANPYQLTDVYGLQGVGSAGMLGKSYTLANNIDASGTSTWNAGKGFDPIGDLATNFTGTFDGLGHTVNDLTIDRPLEDNVGLFGRTLAGIRNIGVVGGAVKGKNYVGGLVGWSNRSTLSNAYATGAVTGTGDYVGGLVGISANSSTISNAYATGAVTGNSDVGGLVGQIYESTISNAYATGAVSGDINVGGLVGLIYYSSISNAYATGAVSGDYYVGGLVGWNESSTISNAYATGAVIGTNSVGGLVGDNSSSTTITNSFWDTQTSGRATSDGGTGKTTTQMQTLSTFTDAGWDIDDEGGTGKIWRIYEGHTSPLLRSFMTQLDLTPDYDGSGAALTNIASYTPSTVTDPTKLLGAQTNTDTLTLAGAAAGMYTASIDTTGLYSHQQGYDIKGSRSITTAGTAANDIALNNGVTWTNGLLNIDTAGTVSTGTTGNIAGGAGSTFNLVNGTWSQIGTLPSFAVNDFRLSGGTFTRALGGDGAVATPYQLTDIYGLQGVGSAGMLGKSYTLANNIDASGTSTWNSDGAATPTYAGFNPLGNASTKFTGTFDGLGHTVNDLTINRPTTDGVGLFGDNDGTINNVGITNAAITGDSYIGGVAGRNRGDISNSYVTGSVDGDLVTGDYVGGLVGRSYAGSSISDSYATAKVQGGDDYIGGLVGYNYGTIDGSYATGNVTATVSATGENSVSTGGLVGRSFGAISNSYATGDVSGEDEVGGLVGKTSNNKISNTYATGAVSGEDSVGGLIGYKYLGRLSNSYAAGRVTGNTKTGGLIGNRTGDVSNSFWNTTTAMVVNGIGTGASTGITGKTTAEMQTLSTFAAWGADIDDNGGTGAIWRIYEGHTSPLLRSFMTQLDLTGNNQATTYDGTTQSIAYTLPAGTDASLVLGSTSGKNAGTYNRGLYSSQQGYDIKESVLTIAQKAFNLEGSRVYDATNVFNAGDLQLTGLIGSEQLTLSVSIPITVTDKNVGSNKTPTDGALGFGNGANGGLVSNYTFGGFSFAITPKAVAVAVVANNKTYDATTTATLNSLSSADVIAGDSVNFSNIAANFADQNAGVGKTVNVTGIAATGADAGNYSFNNTATTLANIDKATLTYVATPNTMTAGTTPNLTGNVTGFVGGESLASATTGGLLWNTAGNTTQPGTYDITGSGLNALNYDFVQAPVNATALTVQAGSIPQPILTTVNSALPSGTPTPTQTQVTTIDVNNPLTASGGEEGESGFINDPQSQSQVIDIVYNSCDPDKDCDKDDTP